MGNMGNYISCDNCTNMASYEWFKTNNVKPCLCEQNEQCEQCEQCDKFDSYKKNLYIFRSKFYPFIPKLTGKSTTKWKEHIYGCKKCVENNNLQYIFRVHKKDGF